MAAPKNITAFETTVQKTHIWLEELRQDLDLETQAQAYFTLRGVLHALRDRLTPDEAAQLASQMPMLVRGFFFEGWRPSATPTKQRSRKIFLRTIQGALQPAERVDPEQALKAVFALLGRHITAGEIDDVAHMLPEEVRDLWPPLGSRHSMAT